MKRTISMTAISMTAIAICALTLLGSISANAQAQAPSQTPAQAQPAPQHVQGAAQDPSETQPLGSYARTVHKNKPAAHTKPVVYDNDNLPTDGISIVGPSPMESAKASAKADSKDAKPQANSDSKTANQDLQNKLNEQTQKLNDLSRELDLEQREYRLHIATYYSDATNRLRDPEKWDKQDEQTRADLDAKQKAVDAARQSLNDLQEQARKAGIAQKENTGNDASGKKATTDGN